MTREQVEHVARAFYEAEYPSQWHEAAESSQEHFRDLARTAIVTLNRQIAAYRSAVKPKPMTYVTPAPWDYCRDPRRGHWALFPMRGWNMIRNMHDDDEALQRLARANAKLGRYERLTNIILGCLTVAAVVALGLVIGHLVGVPWLSHSH